MLKVSYCVSGLNLHSCINGLCNLGICTKITDKTARSCVITVAVKDSKKVLAYLKQRCYNVTSVKPRGAYKLLFGIAKYPIIAVFCACLVLCIAFFSQICLQINVADNPKQEEITSALEDYGIYKGCFLTKISIDNLENYLCNTLSVAHAVVDISGSVLSVEVYPRVDVVQPIDYNSPYDLVASFDGIITHMVVLRGTPVVSVGDKVTKGQVLVVGLQTYPDGTTKPLRAVGEVYAKVYSSAKQSFSPTVVEYLPTDEVTTITQLKIGEKIVQNGEIPYAHYQTESTVYNLFPLNMQVVTLTITKLAEQVKTYTFAQQQEKMCRLAREKAIENAHFTPTDYQYVIEDNGVTAVVWAEISIVFAQE